MHERVRGGVYSVGAASPLQVMMIVVVVVCWWWWVIGVILNLLMVHFAAACMRA